FVSEEVWSWWQKGSVHDEAWPKPEEITSNKAISTENLDLVTKVLAEIRKAKTEKQLSMKADVLELVIEAKSEEIEILKKSEKDLIAAGIIKNLKYKNQANDLKLEIKLA
ncbi:MAG: class I tRNA ligase family protein, partial [Actinomycetes bacterium]